MSKRKQRGYWDSKENCIKAAKEFKTRTAFKNGCVSGYRSTCVNGWLDEVCAHMVGTIRGTWSIFENVSAEAKKYNSRSDFQHAPGGAYGAARDNGWLDEVCTHMETKGNNQKRAIYSIIFPDTMEAYTGLSYDPHTRLAQHYKESSNKHVRKLMNSNAHYEVDISTDWYTQEEAKEEEQVSLEYLASNGYTMLNINNTGGLGGVKRKWFKKIVIEEAKKYETRKSFELGLPGAWCAARNNGWIEEACAHMKRPIKQKGYWSKEVCAQHAKRFNSRSGFKREFASAYKAARINGWMDEICSHMISAYVPKGHWDIKDNCIDAASCFNTRNDFKKSAVSAYNATRKNGWMDEVCAHMA